MPKLIPPEARQLRRLLQEKVLLWVEAKSPFVLFDAPPVALGNIDIQIQKTISLPEMPQEKAFPHVQRWKLQQLNAVTAPMLGCVFEGEADYKVHCPPGEKGNQWILTLKTGTLFSIAPGIPFSDGSKVAWERPDLQKAYSRAFLMQLRPEGVIYHSFTSDKGKLWLHPYIFLYNFEALSLGEKLQREMRNTTQFAPIIYSYWQLIINLLIQTIDNGDVSVLGAPSVSAAEEDEKSFLPRVSLEKSEAIQLAEDYIKNHVNDSTLKVLSVAQHVGISQRHLGRLFQQQYGISPYQYIQQKRLEQARVLLRHSHLTIRQVARYCGYLKLSHFTTWFTNQTQQSPREFRKKSIFVRNIEIKS